MKWCRSAAAAAASRTSEREMICERARNAHGSPVGRPQTICALDLGRRPAGCVAFRRSGGRDKARRNHLANGSDLCEYIKWPLGGAGQSRRERAEARKSGRRPAADCASASVARGKCARGRAASGRASGPREAD